MLKLGEKNISKLYYGEKAVSKAYLGDKLVYKKAGGRFVKSILFDGNCYIDTGIEHQNCTIDIGLTCNAVSGRQLMGWGSSAGTYWGIQNGKFELGGSVVLSSSDTTKYTEAKITATRTETEFSLTVENNGSSITRAGSVASGLSTYVIGGLPPSYAYGFIGEMDFHKFTNAEGVVVQDLRPYVDENGIACFKDVVTGNLFYNQGTGTLSYTE